MRFNQWFTCRILALFVAMIVILIVMSYFLDWIYYLIPHQSPLSSDLIILKLRSYLLPEPAERFVFFVLAIVTPILALLLALKSWQNCEVGSFGFNKKISTIIITAMPFFVAALLYVPFIYDDSYTEFIQTVLSMHKTTNFRMWFAVVSSLVGSIVLCWLLVSSRLFAPDYKYTKKSNLAIWIIFIIALMLQMLSWRLISIHSITKSVVWYLHFDAVIYSLSQVMQGKTLMVDVISQYGFFPELLYPLFHLIGLSVFKLSLLFALMQITSLVFIFMILGRLVKSRIVLILAGIALIMLTYETVIYFAGTDERYYQYWPIRFFWPAVSVLAFYYFAKNKTLARSIVISLLAAIATIWNLDSGICIVIAYGFYLIIKQIIDRVVAQPGNIKPQNNSWSATINTYAILLHILIVVTVVTLFLYFLSWQAHLALNIDWMFKYQKVFYGMGFMMMPLPHNPHPWMSILGIYLLGFLTAVVRWSKRKNRLKDDVLIYLSALGLGLFIYYQGRSHILNLITVCWPAVIISAILADELIRSIRAKILSLSYLCLPIAIISLLLLASSSFIVRIPSLFRNLIHQYSILSIDQDPSIMSELNLIKRNTKPGQECLILALRQGIYYAEAKLKSPFIGSGIIETILVTDEERLKNQFLNGNFECVFLGNDYSGGLNIPMNKVLTNYIVVDKNPEKTLYYLIQRK